MLPLAITSSLVVAQVWVALLNIGAVALCYQVVRTTWNRQLALVVTALFAVSPWAVMYSRRLWITAFDAPLALLAFWLLLRWLRLGGNVSAGSTASRSCSPSGGGTTSPCFASTATPPTTARLAAIGLPPQTKPLIGRSRTDGNPGTDNSRDETPVAG